MTEQTAPIRTVEHVVANDLIVAQAILDVPATLNSLSLEMTRLLDRALRGWLDNDAVCAVVITGGGDKAFCAGGDIQALYHAISANHRAGQVVDDYPFRFFEEEYRLDYLIHTYSKPLLCIGHGIVMGGGLGIFSAAAFRVLTEKSRLAVPEITIGLFPDAGASWTLRNMQPHLASFLGMTGSHVNAADVLYAGMGDKVIHHDQRDEFLQRFVALNWSADAAADRDMISEFLQQQPEPALPEAELQRVPARQLQLDDLQAEVAQIYALAGTSDWIDRGIGNLRSGCPTTAGIVLEQLRRVPAMSLADTFRMELTVGTHCANNKDFHEGVRALLIDKDNAPQWAYGTIDDLDWQHVLSHFEEPWTEHPLADLGDD